VKGEQLWDVANQDIYVRKWVNDKQNTGVVG
jgi:hypothetical protein